MTSVRGNDPERSGTDEHEAASADASDRVDEGAAVAVENPPAPPRERHTPWWKETIILVGTALVLALVIKTFFVQAFYIPSGSMENTLQVNDRILVQKVSYWFGSPQRGDIIVFDDPDNWLGEENASQPSNPITKALAYIGLYPSGGHLVKRVIGVGGDKVDCKNGVVQVNGVDLKESSYVTIPDQACIGDWSVVVPPDHLWVLGDNRENSADSRAHMGGPGGGFIPVGDVVGKVFVTVWPIDRWQFFRRPATFANPALNKASGIIGDTMPLGAFLVLLPTLYRRFTIGVESPARDAEPGEAEVVHA